MITNKKGPNMVNKFMRSALLLVLGMSLTACGFHLRGNIPLSGEVKNMYLNAPDGSFKNQLESVLNRAGAELLSSPAGADVVLLVTKADTTRTVGTLDDLGKANSYNLRFKVTYVLKDAEGRAIRPSKSLVESRRYNFDPATVVGTEAEEAELQESMEQDVSLRIVRQLSTITDISPKTAK